MKLTRPMRDALTAADNPQGLRRVHTTGPGKPPWPAHPTTLAALLKHDLVDHIVDRDKRGYWRETWQTNDAGRLALNPPPRKKSDRPRYLQRDVWRGGDYTHESSRSIDYDQRPWGRQYLETLEPDPLHASHARARHRAAQHPRIRARNLRTRNA